MAASLSFLVRDRRDALPSGFRSGFALTKDNWDDFGHKVQFQLAYIDEDQHETRVGAVKILQSHERASGAFEVATRTTLPDRFKELGENFISLGQEDGYYKILHRLVGSRAVDVLIALRDIAWRPELSHPYEPTSAFRNAMMREGGSLRARRFGRAWVLGEKTIEKPDFEYECQFDGADGPIHMALKFDGEDLVPGRVVGIIGRNAVGKTRALAQLAEDLAHVARKSAEGIAERNSRFPAGRPLFTRIIAISYSAFDRFRRPSKSGPSSYVYCGIRSEKGTLSRIALGEAYLKNRQRIKALDREDEWAKYIEQILGEHGVDLSSDGDVSSSASEGSLLAHLSSGQAILCHFTTALLSWIQPNTLVLFDEPETHLHPNGVGSLFLILSKILKTYDSFAVIATHSPVVLQEIPAKRVLMFRRSGNSTVAEALGLESFGESVTELTRHVFETVEIESLYKRTLKKLASRESLKEAMARFPNGLGLNAQAYLLAQYASRDEGAE
jgi:ABC-type multidrug transport system ATPase subunit